MVSQILVYIDTAPTCALPVTIVQLRSKDVPEVEFGNPIIQKRHQPCNLSIYYRCPCTSKSSYTSVDEYSSATSLNAIPILDGPAVSGRVWTICGSTPQP